MTAPPIPVATLEPPRRLNKRIGAPHTQTTGLHCAPQTDDGPPRKALCRECPFGGLQSSVIPDAEAHVWRADGEQAGSGGFVEEDLVASGLSRRRITDEVQRRCLGLGDVGRQPQMPGTCAEEIWQYHCGSTTNQT